MIPRSVSSGTLAPFSAVVCVFPAIALSTDLTEPRAEPDLVFAEQAGMVAVEAEHFVSQSLTDWRAFHLTSSTHTPNVTPDGDPPYLAGASGGAYLEVLPDTRRTSADRLIKGENFSNEPGNLAVLSYLPSPASCIWCIYLIVAGGVVSLGVPPGDVDEDWLALVRRW